MWKMREVLDDFGVRYQIENVIGKRPNGEDIVVRIPHSFTEAGPALRVSDRLIDGESICSMCESFRNGSCLLNLEKECEEGYYEAFELKEDPPEEDEGAGRARRGRNGAVSEGRDTFDKLAAETNGAKEGHLKASSGTLDLALTGALMIIAIIVFAGLLHKANMWIFIAAYWLTLAVKNIALFKTHKGKEPERK